MAILLFLVLALASVIILLHTILGLLGQVVGRRLRLRSHEKRKEEIARVRAQSREYQRMLKKKNKSKHEEEDDEWERIEAFSTGTAKNGGTAESEWDGIIGIFHPSCHGRGGGEMVLWEAVKAIQRRWPKAICCIYTGDNVDKKTILESVEKNFNLYLYPPTVIFRFLHTCGFIQPSKYKHFTLLGQSLGTLIPTHEALSLLVPDIFIETCNNAFSLALVKWYFPSLPTATYTHYPTISTDMLGSLDASDSGKGVNAGAGRGWKGLVKKEYWLLFARLYGWVGSNADIVTVNSTWTRNHIQQLWSPWRSKHASLVQEIKVIYPPVNLAELSSSIQLGASAEFSRLPILLYIAQFRPEKNHALILQAFSRLIKQSENSAAIKDLCPKLVLLGSVRDQDKAAVEALRQLVRDLDIEDYVRFVCNASWQEKNAWLRCATIGVSGMWCEHFGINVVEYQAAGLISVVNNSGGPREDIVVDYDGGPTGFRASSVEEYATAFETALLLPEGERVSMRERARKNAQRFSDVEFDSKWIEVVECLIGMK